ncbi:carotenoid biosynthesis protein [Pedobacter yulinensis]|uniref:Carotenoid biosynthesis protein n=1 Tax=Pedobacter yulinensis TaxID=2126353 RepID=A0A2T3HQC4_9SPHI|nr:carotenoid biosynthesis protein [Pedobacter yulinensis]PST84587.1 carotenoid biosynthesis protein [Pedobacter yulinensis]
MEGKNDPVDLKAKKIAVAVIIIFHLVGLAGFLCGPLRPYFIQLVPFHLLLMFGVIVFSYRGPLNRLMLFVSGVFVSGFLVEVLGVYTGNIFGSYYYGRTLGLKVFAVPLLMGVNWVILIFSVAQMIRALGIRHSILASLLGAVLLTVLDFFLEPVAMALDFWHWNWSTVPLQNFIAWFVVSLILLKFCYATDLKQQKYVGATMFLAQLAFFAILRFALA